MSDYIDLETLIENNGRLEQNVEIDPIADLTEATQGAAAKEVVADEAKEVEAQQGEQEQSAADASVEAEGAQQEESALDDALKAMQGEGEKPVWDDKAKEVFKKTFGAEDPEAFLSEVNTLKEAAAQAQEQAKKAEKVLANAAKLPYELAKAVEAALEGKDYKTHIAELATGVTLSKAAKDIDKVSLVDKYYKGKFSDEDKEAIKNGEADEDLMERFNGYHGLAAEKHDAARTKEQAAIERAQVARKQAQEADKQSALEAVAFAKNDPVVSKLINELSPSVIDEYLSGELEEKQLYNADGTRSKAGLALLVKGMLFDRAVTRALKGAQAAGRAEAKAKQHAGLPDKPSLGAGRLPEAKGDKEKVKLPPGLAEIWDRG